MWLDSEIIAFAHNRHKAFIGKPMEIIRWWSRGLTGAVDKIVAKNKNYGPAAKQTLLDARDVLRDLVKSESAHLDEHKNDMFVLQGLLLLAKHLYKFRVHDIEIMKQLERLENLIQKG
jgi:hypothetical protein